MPMFWRKNFLKENTIYIIYKDKKDIIGILRNLQARELNLPMQYTFEEAGKKADMLMGTKFFNGILREIGRICNRKFKEGFRSEPYPKFEIPPDVDIDWM